MRILTLVGLLALASWQPPEAEPVWLSTLDLAKVRQGWGTAQADRSVTGKPMTIAGRRFARGVGTHARSVVFVDLNGKAERFIASCGVDDDARGKGSVLFRVVGDGKTLWKSSVLSKGDAAVPIDVGLRGVKTLVLIVTATEAGIEHCRANWADARLVMRGGRPQAIDPPAEEAVILTPPPSPSPRINGPKAFGVRPGSPFLFTIAATGTRPMTFAASGLPDGLKLDPKTGQISGRIAVKGRHDVTLTATNAPGSVSRPFRIVCGDTLALTPHMGWNSWYAYKMRVSDPIMRQAADAMVSTGLSQHGYSYVNIDDGWTRKPDARDGDLQGPVRDAEGRILTNKRFPDMKALTDYIHARGLKAGIYTSPGPLTCGGVAGSYQHEERDAEQFARWGFDFVKYDWCSYGGIAKSKERDALQKPYRLMGSLLRKQPRDLILNLCQYGMGDVWEWGQEVGGHSWRTAGDLGLTREGIASRLYTEVFDLYAKRELHRHGGPGGWNDPDYLLVGPLYDLKGKVRPTSLSPNEQYTHVSFWALVAAPFILGSDITRLDAFTLNLLTNAEVIDVNQDVLGKPGRRVARDEDAEVWARDLEDGSKAVGLFNRGEMEATVTARWADLGVTGKQAVRDLWRQRDLGVMTEQFRVKVPRHGVVLVRIKAP